MELIIDKSFLDAASPDEVAGIWKDHFVIMPDVLFYELITTREDSCRRCFNKIPNVDNPIALLPGIGDLLRYENEMKEPCIPLSQRCMTEKFRFNPRLREGSYQFLGEVLEAKEEQTKETKADTKRFVERCMLIHHFFPEINGIPYRDFPDAIEAGRIKVANDEAFVRSVYSSFLGAENSPPDPPKPTEINVNWAFFRWVQCQLLSSLRLFGKLQGIMPPNAGNSFWTKAEHSMLDTYYVIFGTLAGGLASGDQEVIEDFRLLCPEGVSVVPNGHRRR